MPRPRTPEDRIWEDAARLLLPHAISGGTEHCRPEALTWALIAIRGQLPPGHLLPRLMEEYRAYLRHERGPLLDHELAPLLLRIMEIELLAG